MSVLFNVDLLEQTSCFDQKTMKTVLLQSHMQWSETEIPDLSSPSNFQHF